MGHHQTWNNLGDEIRDAVEDALQTGDFSRLNNAITGTAADALDLAREQIKRSIGIGNTAPGQRAPFLNNTPAYSTQGRETAPVQPPFRILRAPFRGIGKVSGTLLQVFGGIGTVFSGFLAFSFLLYAAYVDGGVGIVSGICFWLLAIFLAMLNIGSARRRRFKRAEKYYELAGSKRYIELKELALYTHKPLPYIVKDVRKMISAGFFPQGHLDAQESCLMLDDRIYSEYLALEKQRRVQELEMETKAQPPVQTPAKEKTTEGAPANRELEAMIAEGQSYIARLRAINDRIPGEVISEKLSRLESLLEEIFESLRDHPEQMVQMQKFMSYYLPTTVKLAEAYEEFDSLSVQGEDIKAAKAEIEKTYDTINGAFGELLNKIFRDAVYDATTDAQVLQTMLAKEGLAGDFRMEESKV